MLRTEILKDLLSKLKLKADIISYKEQDPFIIFDISLEPSATFKKLEKCKTEIALVLKALSEPLIYPITREGIVRIEVMVKEQDIVLFNDICNYSSNKKIPLILGKSEDGVLIADLAEMPHLLISGATGSGKSILLQTIINGLLISNIPLNFALIDTKRVEFSYYSKLNNLCAPVAKNVNEALSILEKLNDEMDRRFFILEKHGARNIFDYKKKMPFIILVIDELADLMMSSKKNTQDLVCRLAQKSRACGIHLIVSTQRPSVNIITGTIKANFPARISCKVSSAIDSRVILDRNGAESLAGKGDAIIDCNEYKFKRFKVAYITESEINKNTNKHKTMWNKLWNF